MSAGGTKYKKFKSKYCAKYIRYLITDDENLGVLFPNQKWFDRMIETRIRLNELFINESDEKR